MSLAYAYFKYLIDRENYQCVVHYFSGFADEVVILDEPKRWDKMACAEPEFHSNIVITAHAEVKTTDEEQKKNDQCLRCLKVFFVVLGMLAVIAAIALMIVAVLSAIATKAYDADQTSRMVAMVLLAVLAAGTICVVIYGEVAVLKMRSRPIHVAAVVLLLLAIVQALIAGISVNVEPSDEAKLMRSLTESFRQAKEDNIRHTKIWAMTQSDLNCCGVYSPEDYRVSTLPYYFPPNVPISCCPSYDSSRSDLVQERDRELCKVKKTYYMSGCKEPVLTVFKETSSMVFSMAVIVIVLEALLLIVGAVIYRKQHTESFK
uniref:Tetraspanin n=1 Tax=Heliothis virescens TaxID=7102 RepID=A0A2A4JE11_HELVI